jgi:DNA repair exonuclease SbcCD nuclease subunit
VVDRDRYELELSPEAIIYAAPCRSTAGADDLAMSLPAREQGDSRIRIGLVHGTTFDMPGHQANVPISREATRARGLDYLAVGDTHGFREIPEGALAPIVYPSAPEPTSFSERDAGYVALVSFRRSGERVRLRRERVAHWTWREATIRSMAELRALAAEDLSSTVLRLQLDLEVSISEHDDVEAILTGLKGTKADYGQAGALLIEKQGLRLASGVGLKLDNAPESIKDAAARLGLLAPTDARARQALMLLHRLMREVG